MKFVIRDDDLNFFFSSNKIEENFQGIWDICPISMSVVPFIKGNWKYWVQTFEELGPGNVDDNLIQEFLEDDEIFPIGNNTSLVSFLKKRIKSNHIYLTLHGIHHRLSDTNISVKDENFPFLAEFSTSKDLTSELKNSIEYLEELFDIRVDTFTPPQNMLSQIGIRALSNNNLNVCHNLKLRDIHTLRNLDLKQLWSFFKFKKDKGLATYPYPLKYGNIRFISHSRLQPGTDLNLLSKQLDAVYKSNGVFVLSTHSYAFDYPMKHHNLTMGKALERIVNDLKGKDNIEFTSLNKAFSIV